MMRLSSWWWCLVSQCPHQTSYLLCCPAPTLTADKKFDSALSVLQSELSYYDPEKYVPGSSSLPSLLQPVKGRGRDNKDELGLMASPTS